MRFAVYCTLTTLVLAAASTARAADDPASYTKDVKPFLEKYCNSCHMGAKPKAGVQTDSYEGLTKNTKKRLIVPGKPTMSTLVTIMESKGEKKMPPKKEKAQPTATEIAKIKAWITAGAKDDSKTSALPLLREDELLAILQESPAAISWHREVACKLE